jgi:long-subunit acyl-CoA synthetase (AMP-forming)
MGDSLQAIARLAEAWPKSTAFRELDGTALSYAELSRRVADMSAQVQRLPASVGVMAGNCLDWVVADLGLTHAGRTIVPLPEFFSLDQLAHVVADAQVGHILTTDAMKGLAASLGRPVTVISDLADADAPPFGPSPHANRARHIVYTSGSTGQPKGVSLGSGQIAWIARSLAAASEASDRDIYLSVMPFCLLLEQICALHVPLHVGAPVILADGIAAACARGEHGKLLDAIDRSNASVTVLVPELLRAYLGELRRRGKTAPSGLRFVPVGGAVVSEALANAAWEAGIPVHEGYGLSECCSVVAVNRPGQRRPGTVGPPLSGLDIEIVDGEIIVSGPSVMDGYLGGSGPIEDGTWRTGDLGEFDPSGHLIVHGRKDSMLVTGYGRNVAPEWIEAMVTADPRIAACILLGNGRPQFAALVVPRPEAASAFAGLSQRELAQLVDRLTSGAPGYARPGQVFLVSEPEMRRAGLIAANGHPRRDVIAKHFAPTIDGLYAAAS